MELAHEAEANVSDLLALECEAHTSALRQRRVQCKENGMCADAEVVFWLQPVR